MVDVHNNGPAIQHIRVDALLLDDENPRLPERLRGKPQSEILVHLFQQGALEELAQSYLDNGFFQHEPLIVVPAGATQYTVVEGNRRLAALEILLGAAEADEISFIAIEPSAEQASGLSEVPCFVVESRDLVHPFVGFRHIGGIKTWPPEAKARYVLAEVRRIVQKGTSEDPFRELGRRVGSNAQGMRNPYIAIRVLLYAREEFGLSVEFVQESRFGVWLRCMNSADIRGYIGLGQGRTYEEIEEAVRALDRERLSEVLSDLRREGSARALLGDSRDVTAYGRVLADQRAHDILRRTRDLTLAKQVIDQMDLGARARRIAESVTVFMDTASWCRDLGRVSRSHRRSIRARPVREEYRQKPQG